MNRLLVVPLRLTMPRAVIRLSVGVRPLGAIVALTAVAATYWLWVGLAERSIIDNDGISILAAQGILDHGYPLLPSDFLYHRGYIPHYLLAGSIGFFGLNDFSIMLPNLLMALGSLWLVYLFARDVIGRPWVGVVTAAALMGLSIEAFYATSPRMYMALQFFTMLAVYSGWRGYVLDEPRFRLLAIVSIGAAILSHREGAALLVAVPAALLVIVWITRHKLGPLLSAQSLGAVLVLVLIAAFVVVYAPPATIPQITSHGGQDPGYLRLSLDLSSLSTTATESGQAMPFGLSFLPIALFLVAMTTRWRRREWHPGPTYALVLFTILALTVATVIQMGARFWLFIMPLYFLLAFTSVAVLVEDHGPRVEAWFRRSLTTRLAGFSLLGVGIAAILGVLLVLAGDSWDLARKAAGSPCGGELWACGKGIEAHYGNLRADIGPSDVVVSSNPWVTSYYLGRVDAYLRERVGEDDTYAPFASESDEYFGVRLIDTLGELQDLLVEERRVWVITDEKVGWASSPQTRDFLDTMFIQHRRDDLMTTYVSCAEPAC